MEIRGVSKAMWRVQFLTVCVLCTNAMATHRVVNVTTNSRVSSETRQDLMTGTETTTSSSHADESTAQWAQRLTSGAHPSVRGLNVEQGNNGFTSTVGNDQTTNNSYYKIMNLGETTSSTNPTSNQPTVATNSDSSETGATLGLTSQDDVEITTLQKMDHNVKATPFLTWTDGRTLIPESTSITEEITSLTVPLPESRSETDETLTSKISYLSTDQQASTPPNYVTTQFEVNQTIPNNRTNAVMASPYERTSTGQMADNNSTATTIHPTPVTNHNDEETTTPSNVYNVTETTSRPASTYTWNTLSTPNDSYSITSSAYERTSTGQMADNNSTATTIHPTQVTKQNEEETTTPSSVYNMTDTTARAASTYIWTILSASTNMSENISTSETEWTVWANCMDNTQTASSEPRRSSKLLCLLTMWILGMIASVFLGLTIFLCVRLSIVKKRSQGQKHRTGQKSESLWAEPPTEARMEFWYSNGNTLEADKKKKKPPKVKIMKNGKRQTGKEEEEDMWIQPRVTLEEITGFWDPNRRGRYDGARL